MTKLKNSNCTKSKTKVVTKHALWQNFKTPINSTCDQTQNIKLWRHSKTPMMTTQKLKLWQNLKTQILTNSKTQIVTTQKLKLWQNSNYDKTQIVTKLKKLKLWQSSKAQIVKKLKNSNCDSSKTQIVTKLKFWQNLNCHETQKLILWHNSKTPIFPKLFQDFLTNFLELFGMLLSAWVERVSDSRLRDFFKLSIWQRC